MGITRELMTVELSVSLPQVVQRAGAFGIFFSELL
jgi:hypothetical protein